MRVKVFRAATLRSAIALLRDELGPDALLLSSRETTDGVEVTAAVEPPDPEPDELQRFEEVPAAPPDPALLGTFVWHNLPPILIDALSPRARETLADACARRFTFRSLPDGHHRGDLLVCGPPGAGRTTAIAALSEQHLLAGRTPMLITSDKRAGAAETLAASTQRLGLTLIVADRPETLLRALARREADMPVLIDTMPLDPFDRSSCDLVASLAAAAGALPLLAIPSGIDPLEAAEYAHAAKAGIDRIDRMLVTQMQHSGRLGGPLAACVAGELALAATLSHPRAASRPALATMTAPMLAERLGRRRVPPGTMTDRDGADIRLVAKPKCEGGKASHGPNERHAALIAAHIAAQRTTHRPHRG